MQRINLQSNAANQIRLPRNIVHIPNLFNVGKRRDKDKFIGWADDKRLLFIDHLTGNFVQYRHGSIVTKLIAMLPITAHTKRPSCCSLIVTDDSELQRREQGASTQIRINHNIIATYSNFVASYT